MFLITTGWLALTATTIVYRFIKFIVFAGILWGALQQILPFPQYDSSHGAFAPIVFIFSLATDRWLPVLAIVSFFYILSLKKSVEHTEQRVTSLIIGTVALLDYFKIGVETDATRQLTRDGAIQMIWKSIKEMPFRFIMAEPPKDEYSAKAARNGAEVTFETDLRNFGQRN